MSSCAVLTCSKRQPLCWGFCLPTGMSMAARNINILDVFTKREIILMGMWPQLEPGVCHRLHHFHRWQSKQDQAILLGSPWKSDIFAPKKWPKNKLAPAILNDHQQYSRVITDNLRRSSIIFNWLENLSMWSIESFCSVFQMKLKCWNVWPSHFSSKHLCDFSPVWCKIVGWWGESDVGWQRSQFWCERGSMHP